MKTYRLNPKQLEKEKRSIIMLYAITLLVLIALAVAINWGRETMQSLLWLVPLMGALYVYMGVRAFRQRQAFYDAYSLEVSDEILVQNQPRMQELRFKLADITNVDVQNRGMLISIKQARNVLGIARETMTAEDYEELKILLTGWAQRNNPPEAMTALEEGSPEGVDLPAETDGDEANLDPTGEASKKPEKNDLSKGEDLASKPQGDPL